MGIQGLGKLLGDNAPGALRHQKLESYFNRKIAVDASMHIYQFMVVIGRVGEQTLQNEAGEVTSHLSGLFYRTTRMLEVGIKPVFVFDGKPPQLKAEELSRRSERRGEATTNLEDAKATGDAEAVEKYSKRTVRVTREHNDDCKKLLRLMGVPFIEAPSEAEAQCCSMAKAGLVYAVATEDMDALTFGTPRLARHLMNGSGGSSKPKPGGSSKEGAGKEGGGKAASAAGQPAEYNYDTILEELKLTPDQFIDMCILCGCDYCGRIPGIGPTRAYSLIQKHGCIEKVLEELDTSKYPLPDPFPYQEARRLFKEPEVTPPEALPPLKWGSPDEEGLVTYLVTDKGFNEDRVRKTVQRMVAAKGKAAQGRLESFFGPAMTKTSTLGEKRKQEALDAREAKEAGSKKAKGGAAGGAAGGSKKGRSIGAAKKAAAARK